jgi:hypothetical protein
VCFISLSLLLSVVSGLLFYKRWWRHLFRRSSGRACTHSGPASTGCLACGP